MTNLKKLIRKTKQKYLVGTALDSQGIPPLHSYGDPLEEVVSGLLIARFLDKAVPQRSQKRQ